MKLIGVVTLSEKARDDGTLLNSREFPNRGFPLRHGLKAVNMDRESRAF
jgi:hypothetical protein